MQKIIGNNQYVAYTDLIAYTGKLHWILQSSMQFRVVIFVLQFTFLDAISFKHVLR